MNKSKLIKTIQGEIARFDFNKEFESELISDLIGEKHYYCSTKQMRPTRFRKPIVATIRMTSGDFFLSMVGTWFRGGNALIRVARQNG
jgi:hypothetical protein